MRFFFFGLLSDRDVLELVLGRPFSGSPFLPARLASHRLLRLRGDSFPLLVSAPGGWVPGILVEGLNEADLGRIHFYESVEYAPWRVEVEDPAGEKVMAQVFAPSERAAHDGEVWCIEEWRAQDKAEDLHEAALWMALYGHLEVAEADRLWDRTLAEGRSLEEMVRETTAAPAGTKS